MIVMSMLPYDEFFLFSILVAELHRTLSDYSVN